MERVGYWIRTKKDKTHYGYTCNLCKKSSRFYKFPFCPFCGSEMETGTVINEKGERV